MDTEETKKKPEDAPEAPRNENKTPDTPQEEKPQVEAPGGVNQEPEPVTGEDLTPPIAPGFPEPTDSPITGGDSETLDQPKTPVEAQAAIKPRVYGPIRPEGSPAGTPPVVSGAGDYRGQPDSKGVPFDPDKHATFPDGRPKPDKRGWWYSNRAGKPKVKQREADLTGNAEPPPRPRPEAQGVGVGSSDPNIDPGQRPGGMVDSNALAAEAYCQNVYALAALYFDDKGWYPESDLEHETMREGVRECLTAYDIPALSPWQKLLVLSTGYASKRATRPNTKEKLVLLWVKVRGWIGWKKKADAQAQADAEAQVEAEGGNI
jgi:hypothetical protein